MLPAFVVAVVFSVPLAAIIGAYLVKLRRMELESGVGGREVEARLKLLEAENRELQARVEVLETIATADDPRAAAKVRMVATATDDDGAEVEAAPRARARRAG